MWIRKSLIPASKSVNLTIRNLPPFLSSIALRIRLTQGAQPTNVVRTLLEKGGLMEKKERPSIAIGKAKLDKEKLAKSQNKDLETKKSDIKESDSTDVENKETET